MFYVCSRCAAVKETAKLSGSVEADLCCAAARRGSTGAWRAARVVEAGREKPIVPLLNRGVALAGVAARDSLTAGCRSLQKKVLTRQRLTLSVGKMLGESGSRNDGRNADLVPDREAHRGGSKQNEFPIFFLWTHRNSLKSLESDEGIQENPSPFSWFGLVRLWFGLDEFGPGRYGVGRSLLAASRREWTKPVAGDGVRSALGVASCSYWRLSV